MLATMRAAWPRVRRLRAGAVGSIGSTILAVTLAVATPAGAHEDDHHRIQGQVLKLSWSDTSPRGNSLSFKTKRQLAVTDVAIDPSIQASSLIVRTVGPAADSSGLLVLDSSRWRPQGTKGWKYRPDKALASSAGLRAIAIKWTAAGGSLKIRAKGESWPVSLADAVESVEIVLTLADQVYCAEFSATTMAEFRTNERGRVRATGAAPPAQCAAVCGNGVLELGEACDDGNDIDDDTCSNQCVPCSPGPGGIESTFDAIQSVVFDSPVYACSVPVCHGDALSGGLDLRAGASHPALVGQASDADPGMLRVFAGDDDASLLYLKLRSKLLGDPDAAELPGAPMPLGPSAVAAEHLEAIRLWIRGGAPAGTVVAGTSELLEACLPAPDPLKTPRPPAPDPAEGFQLAMPPWPLLSQTETQICVATYYDLSGPGEVPAASTVECSGDFPGTNDHGASAGECLAYGAQLAVQDGQSHHLQLYIYKGDHDYTDPGWGSWSCHGGADAGQSCDPAAPAQCSGGVCGGTVVGLDDCFPPDYGPPDLFVGISAPLFLATQEPVLDQVLPQGGHGLLPLKGVLIWNSHAFNFTDEDMMMEAWLNERYADTIGPQAATFFEGEFVYTQDVPAFETREYCATATFDEGFTVFEFLSHVHKRGARFRIWAPPQTPCGDGGSSPVGSGKAVDPDCMPGSPAEPIYESFTYDDPAHVVFDPPLVFTGSEEQRTVKYCALYDNGATDPSEVKRASTSPLPFAEWMPGGPCDPVERKCLGGANQGELCFGDDASCPGSLCDACDLRGGVTSDDEMFILVGYSLE